MNDIAASCAIIATALSYIPGNPPYYRVIIIIMAKLYSNSMIAALNSRMKVVSNSPSSFPPSWNESAMGTECLQGRSTQGIAFIRYDSFGTIENAVWISSTYWYIYKGLRFSVPLDIYYPVWYDMYVCAYLQPNVVSLSYHTSAAFDCVMTAF